MKNLILFSFFFFSFYLIPSITASTLHALLISATNDADIGLGAQRNHQFLKEKLHLIESHTNLKINLIEITGDEVHATKINQTIHRLQTQPNDVIWLHYSGHGINSQQNAWPEFLIAGPSRPTLDGVFQQLKTKPHRLLLVLGDCCNIGGVRVNDYSKLATRAAYHAPQEKLTKLFEQAQGDILAAGSSPRQTSSYFRNMGGVYTSSFMDVFNQVLRTTNTTEVNWDFIFSQTALMTQDMAAVFNLKQEPLCVGEANVIYQPSTSAVSVSNYELQKAIVTIGTFKQEYNIKKNIEKLHQMGYEVVLVRNNRGTKICTTILYQNDWERQQKLEEIRKKISADAIWLK